MEAGNTTYHFLEHSGTRQLAEDIERVRRVFGDQKLSVYGISYGTVVMGVCEIHFILEANPCFVIVLGM